jgi:hypothetical protein
MYYKVLNTLELKYLIPLSCSGDKRGSWAPPAAHMGREMLAPPSAHKRDSVARDHLTVPVGSHREYHLPQQGQQPQLIHGTCSELHLCDATDFSTCMLVLLGSIAV